jgi:UDP-N-acetylglucosamine--N-acetylmuramyl-(pentapeptide) pyrophosphoryl-undecaprenol N-acetylglucosamine transferase
MAELWTICDVAVCRAGGLTVAELAACGIPSVLVPLPNAPDAHQDANAAVLANVGAAMVVAQSSLSVDRLESVLDGICEPQRLRAMGLAAKSVAHVGAAQAIAQRTLSVAR